MAETFFYRRLIKALERLYTQVSLIVLHKRISAYHSNASYKEHARDIKSPLMEFIETTISQAVKVNPTTNENVKNQPQSLSNQPTAQYVDHPKLNRARINELSKYFKKRNRGADLHPTMERKLELSILEHMHAAFRCARDGDKRNSKMHADIVDSACKELAHYMEEKPYLEFIGKVADHLAALKLN